MQVLRRVFDCLVVACICVAGLSLLPLLLVSLRARQWFFVRIMAVAGRLWRDVFEGTRREAIAALDETQSSDLSYAPTARFECSKLAPVLEPISRFCEGRSSTGTSIPTRSSRISSSRLSKSTPR
ncbi:hypothetical protein HPB50_028654 [Hyalomma asiaticum]|nr:hypothetical protein HPB50_028654 [Hyalomma asiaticum]